MHKKHLKFVSISEAVSELKSTLAIQSESKQREEIEPLLEWFGNLEIRKETRKDYPLEFVRREGLWIKFKDGGSKIFYYGIELVELFSDLLSTKSMETVSKVYSEIQQEFS
jgi:hypothetical protein